ncbi:Sel1 repeat [Seminavis robusta]|uniref:Sel1 repeat n=1 Tax=Seminavis robusta TaxID=568900 RepID=A0A9N8H361_9STRA|nr:Sel1 repeat [Seminavis robusta]|eukprot:Sro32_g020570.1 Sel1 repeat (337) ;mRNA; f:4486-5496
MPEPTPLQLQACGACGKSAGEDLKLKRCSACKYVSYCNADCQKSAWKSHKKICEKHKFSKELLDILDSSPTGEAIDWTPETECPICMVPMPHDGRNINYSVCCGKMTCQACFTQHSQAAMKNRTTPPTSLFDMMPPCSFCRHPVPRSNEERLTLLKARIKLGDAHGMETMAGSFLNGAGVVKDEYVAFRLLKQAADHGSASAARMAGQFYELGNAGVPKDLEKAKELYIMGAEGGNSLSRTQLGMFEIKQENYVEGIAHLKIAAAAGHDLALDTLKQGRGLGFVSEEEVLESAKALHAAKEVIESDARKAIHPMMRNMMDDKDVTSSVNATLDKLG